MNIWLFNHYAIPPDLPGGTRHYDFARELVKQGHHVSIFTSSFSHQTRKEERLEKGQKYRKENINGVEFIWLRASPYYGGNDWRRAINMLSYSLRVVTIGLRLKERPDVILASSPHLLAGLAGWLLAKPKKARFIFEVRDLWPQALVDIGGYSTKSPMVKLLRILEIFLYHRAQRIVVLSSVISEHITDTGITSDKIVHIPNGVKPELSESSNAELPENIAPSISQLRAKGKVLVGYAGAHGIANSLGTIVEAAGLLQDKGIDKIHFLLVGDGAERGKLVAKSKSLQLRNITFCTSIHKNSVPSLLRNLDVTAITLAKSTLSIYGSPNKVHDYMMAARPVVSAVGPVDNPVDEANCGITVPPEDAEAFAKAIIKICDMSDNERREMGQRGYEYVMKHHAVPVLANRLMEVMEDVK